ncbi:chemotaxis protein MotB [Cohaesibacter marisflavi]|uniref:Chemotaxis protein MotB n=1 Tax=Cohaesibacter marisflavi TaxID=655353 RepID=A0A1I5C9U0_9HYPH|nr:MotB family protein [Cohaesibacter marisflavi]SFN83759.1 chemotaxis protein MotB [Cohaesibacter marisflavi]
MTDLEQTHDKELIIIRRRHDINIEKPHSGVWKIAHADFMTAMMAFFMVMWLISSTDDAAKKHIARYFNPVKLSAMTSFPKGLEDPDPKDMKVGPEATPPKASSQQDDADDGRALSQSAAPAEADGQSRQANAARSRGKEDSRPLPTFTEAEIFSDPYGVLDRIVMNGKVAASQSQDDTDSTQSLAQNDSQIEGSGGEAMRDPFAPLSWRLNPLSLEEMDMTEEATSSNFSIAGQDSDQSPTRSTEGESLSAGEPAPDAGNPDAGSSQTDFAMASAASVGSAQSPMEEQRAGPDGKEAQANAPQSKGNAREAQAEQAAASPHQSTGLGPDVNDAMGRSRGTSALDRQVDEFRTILNAALNEEPRPTIGNELTVTTSGDDILINVSDSADYGMFAIGSSEPTAQSITLLERIAKSLKKVKGNIIIRGHTDARPFRNGKSDNWRLSTARAHMARFMLIRGGLDENRLLRVEGYADRALKHPDDPEADDNRRIEILVQPSKEAPQ